LAKTRKYNNAATTMIRMRARAPPTTTRSSPPPGLIENGWLTFLSDCPSSSITVRTTWTFDESIPGAVQEYDPDPLVNALRGPAIAISPAPVV